LAGCRQVDQARYVKIAVAAARRARHVQPHRRWVGKGGPVTSAPKAGSRPGR